MHYYNFNIGDYIKSTQHLSLLEDLAYRRLLDRYYDTEKPLEADVKKLCRFIRMSDYEKETQAILDEFFSLTKNGWIQKRVKKELDAYSRKADAARANGKKGGRPKKTQSVNLANPEETQSKAKQETINNKQETINIESKSAKAESIPYEAVVNLYNEICTNLPDAKTISADRKKLIKSFWSRHKASIKQHEKASDFFSPYFEKANSSQWWVEVQANIDTLMRSGKYENIMERG